MKIVYFNYLYDLYGISIGSTRKAEQLMRALSKIGNEVSVHWMKRQHSKPHDVRMQKRSRIKRWLATYFHDPKQLLANFYYVFKEWRILNREKPDVVITRLEMYLFSSLLLCKIKKIPVIVEADAPNRYELKQFCPEFRQMESLAKLIENMNLNYADHSVCVSNEARDYFISQGVRPENLSVITNGADTDHFHPQVNADQVIDTYRLQGRTVIGFIGSFHIWHGIENLIGLIQKTLIGYEDTMFLLVGEGGRMRKELESFIRRERIEDRVVLTGYVPYEEMASHVAAMDIVLALYPDLPFFYYSPVKIFEYMAAGKAVIATQIGQIAELIRHKKNGLLCPPNEFEAIVSSLALVVRDPVFRQRLGRQARRTAERYYSWDQKGDAWRKICQKVCAECDVR